MNFKLLQAFARDEDGAVTVDWIVLTAAVVALAAMLLGVLHARSDALAENTATFLETLDFF